MCSRSHPQSNICEGILWQCSRNTQTHTHTHSPTQMLHSKYVRYSSTDPTLCTLHIELLCRYLCWRSQIPTTPAAPLCGYSNVYECVHMCFCALLCRPTHFVSAISINSLRIRTVHLQRQIARRTLHPHSTTSHKSACTRHCEMCAKQSDIRAKRVEWS